MTSFGTIRLRDTVTEAVLALTYKYLLKMTISDQFRAEHKLVDYLPARQSRIILFTSFKARR